MRQLWLLVLASGLLAGCGLKKSQMLVGRAKVVVEISQTDASRQQGLSGRKSLGKNEGMLFVFKSPAKYKFWMKGMNFPLDFVWIQGDEVVEVRENIGIEETEIEPKQAIDKVLEVNSGWVKQNSVRAGDKIRL